MTNECHRYQWHNTLNTFMDRTRGGWVEACVETYLFFTDYLNIGSNNSAKEVNFKNNDLNNSVSLTTNNDAD